MRRRMPEPIILGEFKCPICGEARTVYREAWKEEHLPENIFPSMEKIVNVLMGPGGPLGLYAPAVLAHYDICSRCGMRYCTRVEKIQAPITLAPQGRRQPPFNKG